VQAFATADLSPPTASNADSIRHTPVMQGGFPFASSITSEGSMTDIAAPLHGTADFDKADKPKLDAPSNPLALILFFGVLAAGLLYMAYSVYSDVSDTGATATTFLPYILLFVALLIALGFEFVNGFHDTANAVATVIYTHALPAPVAVVWAGVFNFLGVVAASGAVAFGIISLLPVELILQVGSGAALPWCSRCCSRRSSGTSAPGISACPRRARTP
jgi:hypothetical protein